MALCELKFFSKALEKQTAATVILPEGSPRGPFAAFYLLHGLSDDHTIWQRRTSIERYVADLPLMVIMPDGGRGFYSDAKIGMAWESALIRDLIPFIDSRFQTRSERGGRCLGGLSMGGYGAIKLALKYPDLFCSAVGHSGAYAIGRRIAHLALDDPWRKEVECLFGTDWENGPDNPYTLAEKVSTSKRPALRIDCGTEDFLLEDSRTFHQHLTRIGYPHEYEEFPGAHTWDYWDLHVQEAITFHAYHLGLKPQGR
jgi:S-formylglutathione hydrolase FrmB